MAIVESIPGITHLQNPQFAPIAETEASLRIAVSPLHPEDISSFQAVIAKGIEMMPSWTPEEKTASIARRTEDYYRRRIENPQDYTVLVARDTNGRIIGGLEGEQFDVDGRNVGFVGWISVDPQIKQSGVATELYRNYENQLREAGDVDFLMANVFHTNLPSLGLHRKIGLGRVFLRKSEPGLSNWYMKPLKQIQTDEMAMPITETDYFPQALLTAVKMTQEHMTAEGLGTVEVVDREMHKEGESLYSIICFDEQTRKTFVRVVESAASEIVADEQQEKPETAEKIDQKIKETVTVIKTEGQQL